MAEKVLNQRERAELRRIAKARFDIIRTGLYQREQEVSEQIRKRLTEEHKATIKKAKHRMSEIEKKLKALQMEARQVVADMEEEGVGLDRRYHYRNDSVMTYTITNAWAPVDLEEKVQEELNTIKQQSGLANLNLQLQELEIMEEITVGAIQSDEGRELLAKIPKLDSLMPLPNGDKPALTR